MQTLPFAVFVISFSLGGDHQSLGEAGKPDADTEKIVISMSINRMTPELALE
jgi:hypothetical protein